MKIHHLQTEQLVRRPRPEVFVFFARPENLARITPPWLDFRILTPSPVPMGPAKVIDYLIRLGPLPQRWRSLISTYEPPDRFVDEQLLGPYSFWHHTHEFADHPQGTVIRDHVRYALPLGVLGEFAHALVVRRSLENIFAHRRRAIAALLEEGVDPESP